MYRDPSWLDLLFTLAVVAAIAYSTLRDRLESDPDPVEQLHERYAAGEIDEQTLERELAFHVDDRNDEIRTVVEDINGVGETTSKALAYEFESLEALRQADREELEAVHGVGESTAEAVLERVRE